LTFAALVAVSFPADARSFCDVMNRMMNGPHPYSGMPMHSPATHPGMRGPVPYGSNARMGMKPGPSVVAIARGAGEFGTLLTALDSAGLTGLLEGDGPYTLFAPTDAAFKKLPPGALEELLGDKAKLVALLKYHVVPGRVSAAEILQSKELKTASGQPLPTTDLSVVRADVPARNGMIQVLDAVLLPSG
jgi:uncharacterized surface protein with fasciclin (FAS1) repeats